MKRTVLPTAAALAAVRRLRLTRWAQFLHGLRVAKTSRAFAFAELAFVGGGLALAACGCGFVSLIFKGADQQAIQETQVCDDLSSGLASEVPFLVELRTDKAGNSRYRDLSLGGAEVDPQWVPMPNQHADATGWMQAGNFTKMDFQPPLQPALTPDSVIYVAYAPADSGDATEQGQLHELNSAFGPQFGSFRWNGRVYRYSAVHKLPCRPPPQ
jgi:hypothetical protein